jgi:hypothetical protein
VILENGMTTHPEKNLHAFVPTALLARAQELAEQKHISFDQLVSDAIEGRLNRHDFEEVLAFGKRHAEARGLKPSDVDDAIAAVRSPEHGR